MPRLHKSILLTRFARRASSTAFGTLLNTLITAVFRLADDQPDFAVASND